MKTLATLAVSILLAAFAPAHAYEGITLYDSDITINKDSSLTVIERITVNSENEFIVHGIERDFPTIYKNEDGDTVSVGFDILSVKRDGHDEPYKTTEIGNGVRARIGSGDVTLAPGRHTFVITYRTTFQLGYFPEGDQLYFNVTGNGWEMPIDKAVATVHLPGGARPTRMTIWTGAYGSKDKDGTIEETTPGTVVARTSQRLGTYEGLGVVVEWPAGFVDKPGAAANAWRWLTDNISALFGLIGLAVSSLFLYWAWTKWGRDPPRGTIIPLFAAPDNMEPAETRYLSEMGYDNKIFAAAVVSMAVKGAVKIEEDPGWFTKTVKLIRTGQGAEALAPIERAAYDQLFLSGDQIELVQANWQRVKAAVDVVKARLQLAHVGKTFTENTGPIFAAIGILIVTGLLIWATAGRGLAPFVGGVAVAAGVVVVVLFTTWMKAPTKAGQAMRDRIDGFRMFLDTAEKERWEVLNPPQMTPQLFEKFLPFALALDVDHTWSQTFEREMRLHEPGGYTYQPLWYSGRDFSGIGAGALSHSISNAMTSAISSSSSPPGKSSGFGGGGFSGGGGGGGGGRGW